MQMPAACRTLALAMVLALPLSAGSVQLALGELEDAPTATLAPEVLHSDLLPEVASHRLEARPRSLASDATAYGAIRFFMRPSGATAGICRRDTWYVPLQQRVHRTGSVYNVGDAQGPTVQLAIADDCAAVPDNAFGWYQSHRPVEDAVEVLAKMMVIQQQVRQGMAPPFGVECLSSLPDTDPCGAGALQVLRTLPLDRLLSIDFDNGRASGDRGWKMIVAPEGPGRPFFQITLPRGDPATGVLRLTWMAPSPS